MKNRPKRFIRSSKEEMLTILSVCRFTIQRLMNLTMLMTWLMLLRADRCSGLLQSDESHSDFFENKVKELTGAAEVIALNSGMAAISNTLFSIAAAGKNIITSRHLFGNTYSFIAGTLSRFGVEPRLCDLTDIGAVEKVVDSNTCCIYVEIITNPQMEVADLQALSRIVHERGNSSHR